MTPRAQRIVDLLSRAGYPPVLFGMEDGIVSARYWIGQTVVTIELPDDPRTLEDLVAAELIAQATRLGVERRVRQEL